MNGVQGIISEMRSPQRLTPAIVMSLSGTDKTVSFPVSRIHFSRAETQRLETEKPIARS
jgi:hypothetical protein